MSFFILIITCLLMYFILKQPARHVHGSGNMTERHECVPGNTHNRLCVEPTSRDIHKHPSHGIPIRGPVNSPLPCQGHPIAGNIPSSHPIKTSSRDISGPNALRRDHHLV